MNWRVVRVNDDGRREVVNGDMCALAADKVAGALRDASTEVEIRDGWNYQAVNGTEPISKEAGPDSGLCFTSLRLFDARWRTEPSKNIEARDAGESQHQYPRAGHRSQGRRYGHEVSPHTGRIASEDGRPLAARGKAKAPAAQHSLAAVRPIRMSSTSSRVPGPAAPRLRSRSDR